MIIIDERVRAKCLYPKCMSYGTNAHCPPHAMDLQDVRRLVERYESQKKGVVSQEDNVDAKDYRGTIPF